MKRPIILFFAVFYGAAAAFGGEFSFSAGAGGLIGGFFTRYTLAAPDGMKEGNPIKAEAVQDMDQLNYGFFAFFDATYGEFSVSYQNGANNFKETFTIPDVFKTENTGQGWESVLGLSLLGKYPLYVAKQLTVFPLLGVEYQICLEQWRTKRTGKLYERANGKYEKDKDGKAYKLEDWNSLWVNLGGGVDLALFKNIFLRGELLYGFRLMTPYEVKNLELMKSETGDPNPKLSGLTSGPSLRISAGYRF